MRKFLLSIILICVLTVPALAHPGGTDSSGGHYDHSTGEYHYHHGYPPHDHEDLDGDGDLDCPYDFKDKTGENSGDSSGSSTRYPTHILPVLPPVVDQSTLTVPAVAEPEQENGTSDAWDIAFLGAATAILYALLWKMSRKGSARRGKPYHGPPVWEGRPARTPAKAVSVPESKRAGNPGNLIWKSAYDEMKHTRITDRYIHIQDLERVANYFAVDNDTALRLLNEDRVHNGMPPFEVLKV